jgi:hypothetical protein
MWHLDLSRFLATLQAEQPGGARKGVKSYAVRFGGTAEGARRRLFEEHRHRVPMRRKATPSRTRIRLAFGRTYGLRMWGVRKEALPQEGSLEEEGRDC